MAKQKATVTVFDELLEKFDVYATRKAELTKEAKASKEKLEGELAQIQKELAEKRAVMDAAQFRKLSGRMNEVFEEIAFYDERLNEISSSPATTSEEYREWIEKYSAERSRLFDECEDAIYSMLKGLRDVCVLYTTELSRLFSLAETFDNAVGEKKEIVSMFGGNMPLILQAELNNIMYFFNDMDKKLNDGEEQTIGYDVDVLRAAISRIKEIAERADYRGPIRSINVPSRNSAYNLLGYNTPWAQLL